MITPEEKAAVHAWKEDRQLTDGDIYNLVILFYKMILPEIVFCHVDISEKRTLMDEIAHPIACRSPVLMNNLLVRARYMKLTEDQKPQRTVEDLCERPSIKNMRAYLQQIGWQLRLAEYLRSEIRERKLMNRFTRYIIQIKRAKYRELARIRELPRCSMYFVETRPLRGSDEPIDQRLQNLVEGGFAYGVVLRELTNYIF